MQFTITIKFIFSDDNSKELIVLNKYPEIKMEHLD